MAKAHVESLEILKSFRTALWKFSESATAAIAEAESEVHRTLIWLETEQLSFWEHQIRKRHDWLEHCKDAYRQKTLFKDAAGHRSSGFDERKAMDKAQRALEESEAKYKNTKRNIRLLQKELQNYTGTVQRFATDVLVELPNTVAKVDKMEDQLRQYMNLSAPAMIVAPTEPTDAPEKVEHASMARPAQWNPTAMDSTSDRELRQRTPDAVHRRQATPTVQLDHLTVDRPVNAAQRMAIATMDLRRNTPLPEQLLTIASNLYDPNQIYLHRVTPVDSTDTGWYIGPISADSAAEQLQSLRIEDLLAIRPDLREILMLPDDFLIILGPGRIISVYNSKGLDLWKT